MNNTFARYQNQNKPTPYSIYVNNNRQYAILGNFAPVLSIAELYYHELTPNIQGLISELSKAIKKDFHPIVTLENPLATTQESKHYIKILQSSLLDIFTKWQKNFNKISKPLSVKIVNQVEKNIDFKIKKFNKNLKSNNWYIPFNQERAIKALTAKNAVIANNVALIRGIPTDIQKSIFQDVMEASIRGRDIKYLTDQLQKYENINLGRAKRIAYDQINKATSAISIAKQQDLGLKYNMWRHSYGDKQPRASHLAANNKVFELDKGCLIDGEYIYPADKINCTCYSVMVLELEK